MADSGKSALGRLEQQIGRSILDRMYVGWAVEISQPGAPSVLVYALISDKSGERKEAANAPVSVRK